MEVLRKTAEFRVSKQTEGMDSSEVTHLSLSGVPLIPSLLTRFPNLTHLTLVCMKPTVKSLTELPLLELPSLQVLELNDNAISLGAMLASGESLPVNKHVRRLLLANNRIGSIDEVQALSKAFPALEVLDMDDNPLDLTPPETFTAVFGHFPNLQALNSRDKTGEEVVVPDSDSSSSAGDEESDEESSDNDDDSGSESESESESGSEYSSESPSEKRARTE